jgi:hypothetical protein
MKWSFVYPSQTHTISLTDKQQIHMTPQELYRKNKHILDAWERGEKIESRVIGHTRWFESTDWPNVGSYNVEWRVATPQRIEARHIRPGSIIHKATWKSVTWATVLSVTSNSVHYHMEQNYSVTIARLNDPAEGFTLYDKDMQKITGE